jgi:hypothetical protein
MAGVRHQRTDPHLDGRSDRGVRRDLVGAQHLSAATADTCGARNGPGRPTRLHARSGVHLGSADERAGATEVHDSNHHDDHHDRDSNGAQFDGHHIADLADGTGADDRGRPRRSRAFASDHADAHRNVDTDHDPDNAQPLGYAHIHGARAFAAAAVTGPGQGHRYTGVP